MAFAHRTRLWRASTRLCTRDLPRLCTCNLPRLCTYDLVVNHIRVQDSCATGHSHALVLKGRSTFSLQAMQAILEPRSGSGNEFIGLMSYMPILYMHCVNTCAKIYITPPTLPPSPPFPMRSPPLALPPPCSQCDPSLPLAMRPLPHLFPMQPQCPPTLHLFPMRPAPPPPTPCSQCPPSPCPLCPTPLPWFPMRPLPPPLAPYAPPPSPRSLCDPSPKPPPPPLVPYATPPPLPLFPMRPLPHKCASEWNFVVKCASEGKCASEWNLKCASEGFALGTHRIGISIPSSACWQANHDAVWHACSCIWWYSSVLPPMNVVHQCNWSTCAKTSAHNYGNYIASNSVNQPDW